MAELLVKIGPGSNYTDGDVLEAFSDRRIACTHAQHICHPRRADRNQSGLILRDSLAERYLEIVSEFRFERISATEIERITLATGARERFGPESIDVRLFIRRRKVKLDHLLFGEDGAEVWFGGRTNVDAANVARVWDDIEIRTKHRRRDERHVLWTMGRLDIRSHLAIRVDPMDDIEAASYREPQFAVDGNGRYRWERIVDDGTRAELGVSDDQTAPPDQRPGWQLITAARRRRKVDWQRFLPAIAATRRDVTDPRTPIGHEYDEPGGPRYTSKTQIHQRKTEITRKPPRGDRPANLKPKRGKQ